MRRINNPGLDFIKSFESLRLDSYQGIAGVWTVGYGHIGNVAPETTITDSGHPEEFRISFG